MGKKMIAPVYAYLDESSSLRSKDKFFVVGLLINDSCQNIELKRILKQARRKMLKARLKVVPELKFNNSRVGIREFVLEEMVKTKVSVIVLVLNKGGRKIVDTPENYGLVIGAAVKKLLGFYNSVILYLDKRYTSESQTRKFLEVSQEYVVTGQEKGVVTFNPPVESKENVYIQLVDFVAGAFNYKYNRGDDRYVRLIEKLVKMEEVVDWVALKKR